MQIYVLAAGILGPRPQQTPKKNSVSPRNYDSLRKSSKALTHALVEMESEIPFDAAPHPGEAADTDSFGIWRSLGRTDVFCVPRNDNLLRYWDTVADRLFKIRNSLNIQGIFRQLPLFQPPIDPGLLAKAAASGLDIAAVVAGVNQPLSHVRYQMLAQRASRIC